CHPLARLPYLLTVYRIPASMFERGSQIFLLYPGRAYARNVGSITCISPLDGVPLLALLSQLLIARGFPLDSVCICISIRFKFATEYCPSILRACAARDLHCSTPA